MPNDLGRDPLSYMGAAAATQQQVDEGVRDDVYVSPATLELNQASTTESGVVRLATIAETIAGVATDIATTPAGVAAVAIAGAPLWSEVTPGIVERASTAEAQAGVDDTVGMSPLKTAQLLATPPAIGGTTPAAGTFTSLTASGGTVSLESIAAALFDVTGAGNDLTLSSDAGRVIINGEEAAANAITLLSAAGGIDADAALQINIASSQNAADSIVINSSAGGIDITASGAAAGEDIDISATGSSVHITSTESAADSITLTSTAGGIDILATGAAAGEDIDITATGSSVHISATEGVADAVTLSATAGGLTATCVGQLALTTSQNAADAMVLTSSAGGIDILATGAAGEDIDIVNTGGSVNITATENAAQAIYIRANGGVTETVQIHADQGTAVNSINILSDVGGVTIAAGLGTADAINITASAAGGGIDVDAGTAGFIVDTTGAISLDAAAASNFTATGAFDITIQSTAGSILINAGEAVADAINVDAGAGGLDVDVALQMNLASSQAAAADSIRILASAADGGIDIDAGTGGITIDSTGAVSIDAGAASNFSVSGAGIDLTLASSAGRVVINGEEAAVDAVRILSAAGGLDTDVALQMSLVSSQNAADAIVINASAGGIDVTAAGAAGEDIDIVCTAGSVNITAGEAIADSMVLTSNGLDIVVTGAAGRDIDVTNTGGSINITATENISSAIVINASGAASGASIDAGTAGFTIGTGIIHAVTAVAAGPYAVLGTDYIISADSGGGAFQINLPAAPETGRTFIIYDAGGAAAANNITISGNGNNIARSGAIAATAVINTAYESFTLYFNGTIWLGQNVV